MSSYKSKAKKAIGSVTNSAGASFAQKQENSYNNQINKYGTYKGGQYAQMVERAVDNLLNRRGQYDRFGTDEVFSDYARDYSALSQLGVADTQAQVGDFMTGGYENTYTAPAGQQSYMNNLQGQNGDLLNKLAVSNQVAAGETANKTMGGEMANTAGAFDYQKWQDKLSALQNGRALWEAAYEAAGAVDRQAYSDNQSYWQDMSRYYGDLAEHQAQRKDEQNAANQEYELDKFSTHQKLAANECRKYHDKGDNAGMKKYLNKQVKAGNITQKMADNLFYDYKYTAPKAASSSRASGKQSNRSSKNGNTAPIASNAGVAGKNKNAYSDFGGMLRSKLGTNYNNKQLESYIESLCKTGDLTDAQATELYNKFRKSSANVFQRTRNPVTGELGLK